jgi:hypothetical protein
VAWHAGVGQYPWLPTNMANWHMIGIECANSGTSPTAPHRKNWPDAQYNAVVSCCAAINRRLSQTSARTIGHKEYAGRAQGKWDPGAIDMDILRGERLSTAHPRAEGGRHRRACERRCYETQTCCRPAGYY